MGLELVTAPSGDVVTLAEMKVHLRVTHSDEDTYIQALINVAVESAEVYTQRKFLTQTWDYFIDNFPDSSIYLPLSKISSVTHIKYLDASNTLITLDGSKYQIDLKSNITRISPAYNQLSFPLTINNNGIANVSTTFISNAVQIRFVVGYGNASLVPESIKQALKIMVTDMYEKRDPQKVGTGLTTDQALLYPYRIMELV